MSDCDYPNRHVQLGLPVLLAVCISNRLVISLYASSARRVDVLLNLYVPNAASSLAARQRAALITGNDRLELTDRPTHQPIPPHSPVMRSNHTAVFMIRR